MVSVATEAFPLNVYLVATRPEPKIKKEEENQLGKVASK